MDAQHTRRRFLQTTGLGAAALALSGHPSAQAASSPAARKSFPFKLGLASYTLRQFPLDKALAMTRRVGLDWICLKSFHLELNASPQEIAKATQLVRQSGIHLYGGGVISMKDEKDVNHAFQYAKAAGMTTIVAAPAVAVLPLVNQKVREFDIAVAIHNHGPGDKVFPTPQSAYEKIKDLDKRVGLCIDVGHTIRIGADPVADAERFADRLLDIHIKDVSEASPKGDTIEIGRGVIDIPAFLRVLLKTNYSYVVSFEYEKDGKDPLPGLAESVGYVRGALAAI